MRRRAFIPMLAFSLPCLAENASPVFVRGKLSVEDGKPFLTTSEGKKIALAGDEPSMKVFRDDRLRGSDMEVHGQWKGDTAFQADPIHTWALTIYKNGKPKRVTYWCDVCYIRTYSPGKCWCCQEETALQLLDPSEAEKK